MQDISRQIAPALSFNGGFVDTVGFIALQGLFTAHVTGNFVTLGVSIVQGTSGIIGKLMALPVFALVVGLTHLAACALHRRNLASLHILLAAYVLLLSAFGGLAVWFGPFSDPDSAMALTTGMVGVAAMAIQNTLSRQHLKAAPPTTLMTGNVTQLAIDIFTLLTERDALERARVRTRMAPITVNLTGFTAGCLSAALLYLAIGLWSLLVPIIAAMWVCLKSHRAATA